MAFLFFYAMNILQEGKKKAQFKANMVQESNGGLACFDCVQNYMENAMPILNMNFLTTFWALPLRTWESLLEGTYAAALFWTGLFRYNSDFLDPAVRAYHYILQEELKRLKQNEFQTSARDYSGLLKFHTALTATALRASLQNAQDYHIEEYQRFLSSVVNTLTGDGETVDKYMADTVEALHSLVVDFPEAIRRIRNEYGFHFDNGGYVKVAETDRMILYQVLPTEPGVVTNPGMKPMLIGHPYVLGPNILAFLPGERRSYAHSFANQSIPTYVRIVKDIQSNPAVQVMTGEDDALDTRYFSKLLVEKHGKPVTLNGACQAGFLFLADLLSGQLDGLVDALITAASPIDGTKSKGLGGYVAGIPPNLRNLVYATKTLPNGNKIIDGTVMSWIFKLKSLDEEFPLFTFYRDLAGFEEKIRRGAGSINKIAAAINYWLVYDRTDLPAGITKLSRLSYTTPISGNGDMPFELFGRKLNLGHIPRHGMKLLICYGAQDRLVEPPSALAPLQFIDAETTEFPKGHSAILTSWSHPESEYALHKRFPNGQRGPAKFHLDLDEALSPADFKDSHHAKAACW
jgi:hypothetical protein